MPYTKPLTQAQRRLQMDKKADMAFLESLAVYKVRDHARDQDVADSIGAQRGLIVRMKKNPGNARLADVRSVAQCIGMTKEAWLAIGGFQS